MQIVSYDPHRHSIEVRLDDKSVLVKGLSDDVAFRMFARPHERQPLWLDRTQSEVLVKMIEYILNRVKISEPSQVALKSILPEVQRLAQGPGGPPAEQAPEAAPEAPAEPPAETP